MEGVRVDPCLAMETIARGLRKLYRDLSDAVDRTPHIISSRPIIESSLDLVLGLYNISTRLSEECLGRAEDVRQ